jgi:hypothetical protein
VTEKDDRESKGTDSEKDVWLPPRLREKLGDTGGSGDDEDFLKKKPANLVATLIAFLIVAAVLGGLFWMIRSSQMKEKAEQAKVAAAARQQVVADSLERVRADSLAALQAQAVADSVAAFLKTPAGRRAAARAKAEEAAKARAAAGTSPAPTSGGAGAAAGGGGASEPATPAAPSIPYGIQVGHYLDEAMANAKLAEFKAASKLPGQVINDAGTFNVVLGNFGSKGAANTRMNALLGKLAADEFIVIPLPKP